MTNYIARAFERRMEEPLADSLAMYTYKQIALIKQVDPVLAGELRRAYSRALRIQQRDPRSPQEQQVGEVIEDICNDYRRTGKIAR